MDTERATPPRLGCSVIMEVTKTFRFEAAHWLPRVPEGHQCGRMHGHSYVVDVAIEGRVDPLTGFVMDFSEIKSAWQPMDEILDHHCLNEVVENPTAEMLAFHIWQSLAGTLPLRAITVHETCTASVTYRGH